MCSQLKPFSVVGAPNSEMLISEKDLNSMEFNFLVRPSLEFEVAPNLQETISSSSDGNNELLLLPNQEQKQEDKENEKAKEKDRKCEVLVSTLRIELPSLQEFKINQDEFEQLQDANYNDGFKTPTSLDQRIPIILPCPPAPRKPKSLPSNKRKSQPPQPCRRVLLDLSNEIESLFPPSLRADLGGKIKKSRQENEIKATN